MTKNKIIVLFFFSFFFILVKGQEYPEYPLLDTVDYGMNVSHVMHYFHYDENKENLIETYWFDKKGKHYKTYRGYEDKQQSITLFQYHDKGNVVSVKGQTYESAFNDSISESFSHELMKRYRNGTYTDEVCSKLYKEYNAKYEKVNPEEINWKINDILPDLIYKRNSIGQDSLILEYEELTEGERYLEEKVFFYYNSKNELIGKKWVDIKNPNILEFQAFKPNSTMLEDSIRYYSGTYREKKYKYFKDTIKVEYYVNGKFTGHEIIKFSQNRLIKEDCVFNEKEDTLSFYRSTYNKKNLILTKQRVKHNGYDGFGYSIDLAWGNIKKYKYDNKDRLIQIDGYEDNKHISVDRFKIIEK